MIIFVANIPFKTRQKEFENLFSEYGTVEKAYIIYDRASRRSKGYGFVTMPNIDEAKKAMETLNGYDFNGKTLVVTEATSKKQDSENEQ
ncbi:MAG: RNA-binding protein [Bacteroidales bacterium]|mgnify:CR=1 FL=1|jgi:RNA recognition motif-containing protein|nr:RNA-binding protein [Bacteroidales bacterium]